MNPGDKQVALRLTTWQGQHYHKDW